MPAGIASRVYEIDNVLRGLEGDLGRFAVYSYDVYAFGSRYINCFACCCIGVEDAETLEVVNCYGCCYTGLNVDSTVAGSDDSSVDHNAAYRSSVVNITDRRVLAYLSHIVGVVVIDDITFTYDFCSLLERVGDRSAETFGVPQAIIEPAMGISGKLLT